MPRYESPYDPSTMPTKLEHVLYEKKGHVAYVTINRPEVRNALHSYAYAELRGVMIRGHCEILEEHDAVKAAFESRADAQSNPSPAQPGAVASAPKRVVLKIVPQKVISWDHRKLGGKY